MILLTGATGNSGSLIARALGERGVKFRVLARDPEKAKRFGAEIVRGDMMEPKSLEAAFKGIEKLMLISPSSEQASEMEANAVAAAKRAGVEHVVKLSGAAAMESSLRLGIIHAKAEKHLQASGLAWTILRPTFFMQNFFGMAGMIKDGAIYYDGRDGKAAHVDLADVADVADVAVEALTGSGHEGKSYYLSGPAAMDFGQVAGIFSMALGRRISYVKVSHEQSREAMIRAGELPWRAEGIAELAESVAQGKMATVTDTVRQITGRGAKSLEQWAGENRAAFGAL